ncbi:MAG: lipoprotein-releasing system transmembrane subunit LolC, partial [Candidatus Dadabacteria bacterium]
CLALKEYGFPLDERIFQMTTLPVYIDLTNFLLVGVSAFVICYAATIYPSYRASRLEPSEVLRYE